MHHTRPLGSFGKPMLGYLILRIPPNFLDASVTVMLTMHAIMMLAQL